MAHRDRQQELDARVRLQGRKFDLYVPLDDGMVKQTAGGAKIGEAIRPPGKPPLTEHEGDELIRLDVPCFWDGWPNENVWPDVARVLALASSRGGKLPDFKASGPMPYSGMRFQMEAPEWGDGDGSPFGGRFMVRQKIVLKLVEFNDPNVIDIDHASHSGGVGIGQNRALIGVGPGIALTVTLHAEETLLQVSAHEFGKTNRAKEIGDLNGIRDVRQKLPVGTVLKLPPED